MKKLALVINWMCLVLCLLVCIDLAVHHGRSNDGSLLLLVSPFATALAAYHFQPRVWFIVLAAVVNAMWALAGFASFALMFAWRGRFVPMPIWFHLVMLFVLLLCSLNIVLLVRQSKVPTITSG